MTSPTEKSVSPMVTLVVTGLWRPGEIIHDIIMIGGSSIVAPAQCYEGIQYSDMAPQTLERRLIKIQSCYITKRLIKVERKHISNNVDVLVVYSFFFVFILYFNF